MSDYIINMDPVIRLEISVLLINIAIASLKGLISILDLKI